MGQSNRVSATIPVTDSSRARAEAHAVSNGATSIDIDALAGVAFNKANGFVDVGRGRRV
jgi:hypothetical protein